MGHTGGTMSGLSLKKWTLEIGMGTTRLHVTTSVEEQWRALAGPWLREQAGVAWADARPTVVLTPSRAESFYLRSRLVAEGTPYLGLRFLTPSDARKYLQAEMGAKLSPATQAELRLLARVCAETATMRREDNPTTTSVIREPSAFLRAYDLLLGAGWEPAQDGAVYSRDLAQEFARALKTRKIATQAELHRQLRREAGSLKKPLMANLFVCGFNAAHWPLWDLLKAVVFAADNASVALSEPRYFAQEIDQLWIGSWEEELKSEAVLATPTGDEPDETPFSPLAASYEQGTQASMAEAELCFRVTPDMATQARAIVLQALEYLKRDECSRLGIVFPEANALALEVGAELRRQKIPLDDGTGAWMPGLFETRCWQSWLALQEEPGAQRLIAWVRACDAQDVSYGAGVPARSIASIVDGALGESLVDNLDVLADHLEAHAKFPDANKTAEFLRRRIALPDRATFARFLTLTREAMALSGWEDYLAHLQADPPEWLLADEGELSRRTFLGWLREATASRVRTRGADGNHFYGKVHLLIYGQLSGQTWSHLILAGLNEGVWPRVFETGAFGSRHELLALNKQARVLNVRGIAQGGQGEGHETVAPEKGHCLLPLERQDLGLRDLCAALEGTTHAVYLSAITTEAGRSLLPSDFFNHAFQAHTGRMLDEDMFRTMANATEDWCRAHEALFDLKVKLPASELAPTRIAYEARRDETRPFGPYEFAYASPPAQPIQLRCKEWESAWNHPSAIWLERVVGAAPWPEGMLSWPQAVGNWVHRWLAAALRESRARNAPTELPVHLWAAADREAAAVRNRARAAGLELYPWWEQVWNHARTVALVLAETLTPLLQDRQFLAEFRLPPELMIALPGSDRSDFLLKGRIDLLLIEPGSKKPDLDAFAFAGCACWVVDFKTGSADALNEKRIGEGKGLQAVLYALATRAMGAASTAISLHTPDANLKQQVMLETVLPKTPILRSLEKLHRAGVFGMRPDAESDYGFSPDYPLATRFIPRETLEAKWNLTHTVSMPEVAE
jgi:hypothetical protein